MNLRKLFILLFVQLLPIALMGGSILSHQKMGSTVVIKTEPVDPADPLYGQYIDLNYAFNQIEDVSGFASPTVRKVMNDNDKTLYLLFKKSKNKFFELSSIQTKKPSGDDIYIEIKDYYYDQTSDSIEVYELPKSLSRYYFDERDSKKYNNTTKKYEVTAKVHKGKWLLTDVK